MQERVKSPGANAVSVMRQLLHHGQSKDRLVRGVQKHVNPYESVKKFPLLLEHRINIPFAVQN